MSEIWAEAILVGPSVTEVCVAVMELVAHHAIVTFEESGVRLRPIRAPEASPTSLQVIPAGRFVCMRLNPHPGPVKLEDLSRRLGCMMLISGCNTSVDVDSERVVHAGIELWSYARNGSGDEVEVRCDERGLLIAGKASEIAPERVRAAVAELRAWTQRRFGLDGELWPHRPPPLPTSSSDEDMPF